MEMFDRRRLRGAPCQNQNNQMVRTHENRKKVIHEMPNFKKTRRNKFKNIAVGRSINRCAAKRHKKAIINRLEVIEPRGAVFLRPDRFEARKRIDDHLRHVSDRLAPGGAKRFRRPHSADGQTEQWLDSADCTPVQVKKQMADVSDTLMVMKQMVRTHENRKKVIHEMPNFKKTRRNKFKNIAVGRSINRCAAKRHKKAIINRLEVIEPRGAVFLRPDRFEARKRIDDHLRHVSDRLAPGGAKRFRRPHSADGQTEQWLDSADCTPVQVKKQMADVSDTLMVMKQMVRTHENRKKVIHEMPNFKKTRRNKFKNIAVGRSINRCAAKRHKKAILNRLEVIEPRGAVFLRPDRFEARKRIDDHLRHVSDRLAPGGAKRFRRPHSADGQTEQWLDSADCTPVQVKKQMADVSDTLMVMKEMKVADTSDSLMAMKDTLPLSTSKLFKARKSCGGGPKKKRRAEIEDKETKVKDLSIQIEEGIDLDSLLKFDIFKDGKNERFKTPVRDQINHSSCGPVSITDSIGLTYALRTKSDNPYLSAQEPLSWMELHEPCYYMDPVLLTERTVDFKRKRYSFTMSMSDVFSYVQENGIHTEVNYPFVGYCKADFLVDVNKFEKMRSSFKKNKLRERFSITSFKHLDVDANKEREAEIIKEVKAALRAGRPVNGLISATQHLDDFRGHAIFDQELDGDPNHIVMITGYGKYKGIKFFKIKNSWTLKWADGGYAFIAIRQFRQFAYTDGEVYSMGPTPPKRVMVFYTTEPTERLAKAFAQESNEKYVISSEENLRHSNVIFIPNDLEDYTGTVDELRAKFNKESIALFLMDNEERSKERVKDEGEYLASFYELLNMEDQSNWAKDLRYAVFGLHEIAGVTDRSLEMRGAERLVKMLRDEVQFNQWKSSIWMEFDKEYKV